MKLLVHLNHMRNGMLLQLFLVTPPTEPDDLLPNGRSPVAEMVDAHRFPAVERE